MGAVSQATFGTGCFWCTEAVFQRIHGVLEVIPGYAGGHVANPSYRQVCGGETGHAEAVRVQYDPDQVSFKELLDVFWQSHDPTSLNRQGADAGTQYRSVIFYHDPEQKRIAEEERDRVNASGQYDKPVVTELAPAGEFYEAEPYHHDYYRRNPHAPYCRNVIVPKLQKLA